MISTNKMIRNFLTYLTDASVNGRIVVDMATLCGSFHAERLVGFFISEILIGLPGGHQLLLLNQLVRLF